jgi:hypothetical protein
MTFKDKYSTCTDWKERACTIAIYHAAMIAKHDSWSISLTAKYFEISASKAGEDIKLVDNMPLVAECKSRNIALKVLK